MLHYKNKITVGGGSAIKTLRASNIIVEYRSPTGEYPKIKYFSREFESLFYIIILKELQQTHYSFQVIQYDATQWRLVCIIKHLDWSNL